MSLLTKSKSLLASSWTAGLLTANFTSRSLSYRWLDYIWNKFCNAAGRLVCRYLGWLKVKEEWVINLFFLTVILVPFVRFRTILVLLSATFALLLKVQYGKPATGFYFSPLLLPFLLLLAVQWVAAVTALQPLLSLSDWLVPLASFLLLLLTATVVNNRERVNNLLFTVTLSCFLVAVYAIYYFYYGLNINDAGKIWIDPIANPEIENRAYAVFDNPNLLGHYFVLTLPLVMAGFIHTGSNLRRFFFFLAFAGGLYCLVLTYSRGAWLGLATALLVFLLLRLPALVPITLGGALLLYSYLPRAILVRLANITNPQDASNAYRLDVWRGTTDLLRDHWFAGVGYGWHAFARHYYGYMVNSAIVPHAHNLYLQVIAETGIAGLLTFIWAVTAVAFHCLRSVTAGTNWQRTVAAATGGILAGFLVHSLVDYTLWYYSLCLQLYLSFGLLLGCTANQYKEK